MGCGGGVGDAGGIGGGEGGEGGAGGGEGGSPQHRSGLEASWRPGGRRAGPQGGRWQEMPMEVVEVVTSRAMPQGRPERMARRMGDRARPREVVAASWLEKACTYRAEEGTGQGCWRDEYVIVVYHL